MAIYRTQFAAYSVAFSPFEPGKVAACSSQYFGVVGNGALEIASYATPRMTPLYQTNTQDSLFDLSWNEANENQVLVACGDGSLKIFDTAHAQPVLALKVHEAEVFGTQANHKLTHLASTASYDQLVKVVDLAQGSEVSVMRGHTAEVYSGVWHPRK